MQKHFIEKNVHIQIYLKLISNKNKSESEFFKEHMYNTDSTSIARGL